MYLHLGAGHVVTVGDVVAILDGRTVAGSEINREFFEHAQQARRIRGRETAGKSFVVTANAVYPSGISAATLTRRMAYFRQAAIAWEAET